MLGELDLEAFLSMIDNEVVRAKVGMSIFEDSEPLFIKYAEQYIALLTQGGEAVSSEYEPVSRLYDSGMLYEQDEGPALKVLKRLPRERAISLANEYVEKRLGAFREQNTPNTPSHVDFSEMGLMIHELGLSVPAFDLCFWVNGIIEEPSIRYQIPEDIVDRVLDGAWSIVQNAHANGRVENVCSAFYGDRFKSRYAHAARDIAQDVAAAELAAGNAEGAFRLVQDYELDDLEPDMIRRAVILGLKECRFEYAETIARQFGYALVPDDISEAKQSLEDEFLEIAVQDSVEETTRLISAIRALDNYGDRGLNVEDITQVVLPEGYDGKFLLIQFGNRVFFRCDLKRDGVHQRIVHEFQYELSSHGYEKPVPHPLGGAHISFNPDGHIEIQGQSQEYGECNKVLAKELVSTVYPDRDVITNLPEPEYRPRSFFEKPGGFLDDQG